MGWNATKLEKSWALYDVANSAYVLLVCSVIPIYFKKFFSDENDYFMWWAVITTLVTILMVFIGPIVGGLSDKSGWRKPIFMFTVIIGAGITVFMGLPGDWMVFALLYVVSQLAFYSSITVNDSMLNDVTTPDRMDTVSSKAYSWGYIGSCIPFIACCACIILSDFKNEVGGSSLDSIPTLFTFEVAIAISLVITAAWWILFSFPLFRHYKQKNSNDVSGIGIKGKLGYVANSAKEIYSNKTILFFIVAYFFYIDGVNSIISMSTAYGEALKVGSINLLLAMLLTQLVAFPCTLVMNRLSKKYGTHRMIIVAICIYLVISFLAIFLDKMSVGDFNYGIFILAFSVGLVQGGIQALSRSYFGKMVPKEKTGEYFGILDIFGKSASIVGAGLSAIITAAFGVKYFGFILLFMFAIGLILFYQSTKIKVFDQNEESNA